MKAGDLCVHILFHFAVYHYGGASLIPNMVVMVGTNLWRGACLGVLVDSDVVSEEMILLLDHLPFVSLLCVWKWLVGGITGRSQRCQREGCKAII